MSIILRIDVDRPYGKSGIVKHIASRICSDYYFPKIERLGYLADLKQILFILNIKGKSAYVFYRKCTFPSASVMDLMKAGNHIYGLHFENSRSSKLLASELLCIENRIQMPVKALSKHGSGLHKYGWRHYPPYEPGKYCAWAKNLGFTLFSGNLQDPSISSEIDGSFIFYPSAFWLESDWRNTLQYPIEWLITESKKRDIIMLLHPDNVTASRALMNSFIRIIDCCHIKTL